MISLKKDFKQGLVTLKVTHQDDLWYLSHIIANHDLMRMKTERKLKIGDENNPKIVRKTITLTLDVEDVTLQDDQLRIKGTVHQGTDDVATGSYHSFGLSVGDQFTLQKTQWPTFVKKRLDEALNSAAESVLCVVYDRDQAFFSLIRQTGIEFLTTHTMQGAGKSYASNNDSIYADIIASLQQYDKQYTPSGIIIACPSFWMQYVKNILEGTLKKKAVFLESNDISKESVYKLMSRPEVNSLVKKQRVQVEETFLEEALVALDKDELAYGFDDVNSATSAGAIRSLGVTDDFLKKSREEQFYDKLDALLKNVDAMNGTILFISSQHVAKQVNGLGGIVGILRWKQQ